jgi:hypothetical protein
MNLDTISSFPLYFSCLGNEVERELGVLDASELRPRPGVETTSFDRLAVNENIFMRSET